MPGPEDDDAWRSIIDNYGERPQLDEPGTGPTAEPVVQPTPEPDPWERAEVFDPSYDELDAALADDQRFIAPDPGPQPLPERPRLLAWIAVLAVPTFLLVCAIANVRLADWLLWLLIASTLGGFGYLVATMPQGPRDPWDDGSRV